VGNNTTCSGTLFEPTLTYVLTAAHCASGLQASINTNSAYVSWQNNGGNNRLVQSFTIDPNYNSTTFSDDIAILKLASPAPSTFAYYPIYTGSSELGQNFTLAGYGDSGTGTTGIDPNYSYTQHILRQGQNTFDGMGSTDLYYDFDNGTSQNNAFAGTNTGVRDASGNLIEATIAPGDSGGPSFLAVNGQLEIAGIHSFTGCFATQGSCSVPPAISPLLNSSFGDYAADTRVSLYTGFIDSYTGANAPEPGTFGILGLGLGALGLLRRRR
jgi:secreted trypsin-like serine protease